MVEMGDEIPPIRNLRRVVPIARTDVHGGMALTLLSLDDYADGFDLRYHLIPQAGHPIRDLSEKRHREELARLHELHEARRSGGAPNIVPMQVSFDPSDIERHRALWPKPLWLVRDDRGNSYPATERRGGSEHASGEFRMAILFAPAIDPTALELRIEIAEIIWTTHPPMHFDPPPVRVDPGPWIFTVDLTAGLEVVRTGEPK